MWFNYSLWDLLGNCLKHVSACICAYTWRKCQPKIYFFLALASEVKSRQPGLLGTIFNVFVLQNFFLLCKNQIFVLVLWVWLEATSMIKIIFSPVGEVCFFKNLMCVPISPVVGATWDTHFSSWKSHVMALWRLLGTTRRFFKKNQSTLQIADHKNNANDCRKWKQSYCCTSHNEQT